MNPFKENPDRACRFTKHRGELWKDVVEEDRPYVEWIVSYEGPDISDGLYDYLMDLLEGW